MSDNFQNGNNLFLVMQEAVRTALNEAADQAIKEKRRLFEIEMGEAKRSIVGRLAESIQIEAQQNEARGEYVIQIRLNGGRNNER